MKFSAIATLPLQNGTPSGFQVELVVEVAAIGDEVILPDAVVVPLPGGRPRVGNLGRAVGATSEPAPQKAPRPRRSSRCGSKPYCAMLVGSKPACVASLLFVSTVSSMASCAPCRSPTAPRCRR